MPDKPPTAEESDAVNFFLNLVGFILIIAVFIGVTIGIRALVAASDKREIGVGEYRLILEWVKEYPALQPKIDKAMEDGKITNEEFVELRDVYLNRDLTGVKEQLKR